MAGSLKRSFVERSRERLLPQKGYDLRFTGDEDESNERANCCCFRWFCGGSDGGNSGGILGCCNRLKEFGSQLCQMGRSDPRKLFFATKMGMSLAFVSCIIFWKNPKEDLTKYSIWAILTVVVCFEFSVGASLSKGANRALGTLTAGGLAFGLAELAAKTRHFTEPLIVVAIFVAGFSASYIKLHPTMKAYEYGFRVFLLTYCIVMVTGHRTTNFFRTAFFRLFHIAIGASVASIINICILPIWAGEDLHKLIVKNFYGVATSLEGCVNGYVQCVAYERIPSMILTYQAYDDPLYGGYRAAFQSTGLEESLMDFAKWEPPHGPYRSFRYPWEEYVKLSGALRYCAFMVMSLHGCVLSEIQAPAEMRQVFAKELRRVGIAGAKVLRELGSKVEKMEKLSPGDLLSEVHDAAEELQMKIDQKSYLLVNMESWEEGKRPKEYEKGEEMNEVVIQSLSEDKMSFESEQVINMGRSPKQGMMFLQPELSDNNSEHESKTLESATSLSLATFASILVELVARLAYLVKSFEELSRIANFKDPAEEQYGKNQSVGFWRKFVMCCGFRN